MYLAAGHYGQLIIILPSQRMVIAATGRNTEYWSKIDKLVSHAIACYSPESKMEAGSTPPPSNDSSMSLGKKLKMATGVLGKGYLQSILAKEFCSCVYVSGLTMDQCKEHSNLPISGFQLWAVSTTMNRSEVKMVKTRPTVVSGLLTGFKHEVRYGQYLGDGLGCRLAFSGQEARPARDN